MDPDETLAELRRLDTDIYGVYYEHGTVHVDDAVRMAELIHALDQWISSGGYLPAAWQRSEAK